MLEFTLQEVLDMNVPDVDGPLIYQIMNMENGESYIGQTSRSLHSRFVTYSISAHRTRLYNGDESLIYQAIRKFGIDKFEVFVLDSIPGMSLSEQESYYIKKFDSEINGYNETSGGHSFSKYAQCYGAYKLSQKCRSEFKGAFFNEEIHSKICSMGGKTLSKSKAESVIKYLKDSHLAVNKENFDKYRLMISNHNCPKFDTVLRNYPEIL